MLYRFTYAIKFSNFFTVYGNLCVEQHYRNFAFRNCEAKLIRFTLKSQAGFSFTCYPAAINLHFYSRNFVRKAVVLPVIKPFRNFFIQFSTDLNSYDF